MKKYKESNCNFKTQNLMVNEEMMSNISYFKATNRPNDGPR